MALAVGEIVAGKVTGITKFGAFVALDQGKSGLVHISEVSQSYVNDVHDYLSEGQDVKVKIIAIDDSGRINLSIKKAQPKETAERTAERPQPRRSYHSGAPRRGNNMHAAGRKQQEADLPLSFEDKLKHFMQDSESRMSDIRHNMDRKSGSRRRR